MIVCLFACDNKPNRPDAILDETYEPAPIQPATTTTSTTTPPPPGTPEPAQNADGVWHYTCPNGCEGGGGSAAPCSVCGATLAHNTLYHNNANAATTPANPTTPTPITPPTPPTPEPAQNAAGVWHYTCGNGCAGGAGSAVACATCGGTLAHNPAYHQ